MAAKIPTHSKRAPRPAVAPDDRIEETPRSRQLISLLLVALGAGLWIALGTGHGIGSVRWIIIGCCGALGAVASRLGRGPERLRNPSSWAVGRTAVLVWFVATAYFILTAFLQNRDLFPKTHDDSSYAIGMQMVARGRLWMPAHPLADFFDSFYILVRPVYCSIYFPGTALIYSPTVWLGLPLWLMPAVVSGAAVMVLYLIVTELIDGAAGLLAALLLVSLTWFRTYSVLLTSQSPMLLLGLLIVWAWLRWRNNKTWYWSLALGAVAGWAAITRPVDAVCFALPVGIGMLLDLLTQRPKVWAVTIGTVVAGALPFLVLQIIFNVGVTGSPLRLLYTLYLEQDQPGSTFGFRALDPNKRPPSPLPQKQAYYDWCKTYLARHQLGNFLGPWVHSQDLGNGQMRPAYLSMLTDTTMPARILLLLAPVGLLALMDRRRGVLAATLPLFILLYVFNPFFLEHYAIAAIPAVILLVLLGTRALAAAWPRWSRPITAATVATILAASLTSLWEIDRWIPGPKVNDETFPSAVLHAINVDYPPALEKPAVVLFRFHRGDDFFREPVYNWDVAWPDDAPVVRAHDLGVSRDREIVEYYAKRQAGRTFYLFDAKATPDPMVRLGRADEPEQVMRALAAAEGGRH